MGCAMSSSRRVKGKDRRKHPTPPPPKQKGSVDKVPGQRKIKASIRSIIQDVVENKPLTVRHCIERGLRSSPRDAHHYLKIAANYLDGLPDANMTVKFDHDELADAKHSLHKKLDVILKRLTTSDAPS